MNRRDTQMNPGKAGPKGALAEKRRGKAPASGPRGNEGGNTRRDFVRLARDRKQRASDDR